MLCSRRVLRSAALDNFIHRENLALYKKRLAETTDERARRVLLKLLVEEEEEEEAKDAPSPQQS